MPVKPDPPSGYGIFVAPIQRWQKPGKNYHEDVWWGDRGYPMLHEILWPEGSRDICCTPDGALQVAKAECRAVGHPVLVRHGMTKMFIVVVNLTDLRKRLMAVGYKNVNEVSRQPINYAGKYAMGKQVVAPLAVHRLDAKGHSVSP